MPRNITSSAFFSSLVRRGGIPLLLGVLTFWTSIRGAGWPVILVAAALAVTGALSFKGNAFSRAAWLITPFWAIAAASWSGALLGVGFGALLFVSLRNAGRRTFLHFGWTAAAFFVFVNAFVFSSHMMARQNALLILAAASLAVVLGAHLASLREAPYSCSAIVRGEAAGKEDFDIWPTLAVCLILVMQLLFVVRLLPYGYLSLAAIAAVWYFALLALYEAHIAEILKGKKIGQEILFAAALTLLIAASSGIRPR